jgi:tetratricopeptide (TPR) repeat protein
MPAIPPADGIQRLRRLENYLAQDPANPYLLADTCDAAIAAGEQPLALRCIAEAERLQLDPVPWTYRRALAALFAGDPGLCRKQLEPLLDTTSDVETLGHLQALWLRASHHLGSLAVAWEWALQQHRQGRLQPVAAGVASLVAIDLERLEDARSFSDIGLRAVNPPPEAQVARAYVALADDDPGYAGQLLESAIARHPQDGRTWSALGMVSLRATDLPQARQRFERATGLIPRHIGTWHALGWTCILQQDLSAAHAAFAQALQLDRNFGENHAAMALVFTLEGRDGEAGHHLERAERLDRAAPTARYVRALRSGELRDADAVRAFAARLLQGVGSRPKPPAAGPGAAR